MCLCLNIFSGSMEAGDVFSLIISIQKMVFHLIVDKFVKKQSYYRYYICDLISNSLPQGFLFLNHVICWGHPLFK